MDGPDWVERIPDLAVKKTARIDMLTVQDTIRVIDYFKTLEGLRALNAVSIAMFSANEEDVHAARDTQDLSSRAGKTWDEQVKASDEKTKALDNILTLIGQSVPSDSMIETQALAKAAKKVQ
jgi:hypothetical protein